MFLGNACLLFVHLNLLLRVPCRTENRPLLGVPDALLCNAIISNQSAGNCYEAQPTIDYNNMIKNIEFKLAVYTLKQTASYPYR